MPGRRTTTVLMLDVVDSTQIAAELGDARNRELASRFAAIVRRAFRRFGGREEDHAGDGFFATFAEPDQAILCAATVTDEVRALGIEIRSGIHTGQVETLAGKAQGIAVVIGARVMSLADAGQILVTGTAGDLAAGSGFAFDDLGTRELKGVPGTWRILAATSIDGAPLPGPLSTEEAAERRARIEPGAQQHRRRLAPLAVGGVLAVAVIAGIVYAAGRDADPTAPPARSSATPTPESVVRINPTTGEVRAAIEAPVSQRGGPRALPPTPMHPMAAGEGGVWILRSFRWLYHIDPVDEDVRQVITLEGHASFSLNVAAGYDKVWVAHVRGLIEVEPSTDDHILAIPTPGGGTTATDVAVGGGSVWFVSSEGHLYRIDPRTLRRDSIELAHPVNTIAYGHGSLWSVDAVAETVSRYDPTELRRTVEIPIQGVDALVVGESTVWALSSTAGTLTAIDLAGERAGASVQVGEDPTGLAAGAGWIFVGDEDGVIRRIDEGTRDVSEIPLGAPIRGLAFDGRSDDLWVDVAGPGP